MIEGFGAGYGSGFVPLTNGFGSGFGSRRPKSIQNRIPNIAQKMSLSVIIIFSGFKINPLCIVRL
jgi:hypothetical protein